MFWEPFVDIVGAGSGCCGSKIVCAKRAKVRGGENVVCSRKSSVENVKGAKVHDGGGVAAKQ